MLLGTGVEAFEGDGASSACGPATGATIDCDFVVVGVGVQPRTELAAEAGHRRRQRHPRRRAPADRARPACSPPATSPTPHHPFYGERIRVEHWANALNQGPVAARNMLGQQRWPTTACPYFFSDQYDVGMEYTGFARAWDRVVFRGDPATREFIAFWLAEDRVVAGMNVNVWDVTDPIKRLIRERVAVDDRTPRRPRRPARGARPRSSRERRMNRLQALHDAGVSIWLDTLSRELLDSGEFAALIADYAVTGATSNPTIFAKAITGSDRYDDQLRAAVASGMRDPQELFFELALDDVRRAADLLRPAYDASDGRDGFISFECTPDLADDTEATIEQATRSLGPARHGRT